MFANLSEYNENLRAQDAARAARRQQPQGLASYQAKKAAQEAARLAPYSVEKSSYYSSAPWAVSWDGKAIGEFFPTKKAAIAWIEEQKQKEQQKEERPETISNDETPAQEAEQKEEKKMYTWHELKTMEKRFDIKHQMQEDVKTLETIYAENVSMYSARPDETIREYVAAVGYGRAAAAVASLVNYSAWDGRIDKKNAEWTVTVPGSIDDAACCHFDIYTNRIHMCHLNQLADVLRNFTPDETPENHSETDETPAQDAETPAERPETISTEKKEEQKTMKKVEFTPAAIIVNGQEYAARYEYGETPRGHLLPNIRIFTALSGNACIVEMDDDDAEYMNARAIMEKADETETPAQDAETPAEDPAQDAEQAAPAAEEEQQPDETPAADPVETPAEQPETPAEDPAQDAEQAAPAAETDETETPENHSETDETETPENHSETDETPAQDAETPAEDPARDGKQARGPVPEKTFIGTAIQGKGYSIIFDGGLNRTRVIVTDETREKLRPAIEKAGFYYSAALDSWNKKLTFRAFRAAQALAAELDKILAA